MSGTIAIVAVILWACAPEAQSSPTGEVLRAVHALNDALRRADAEKFASFFARDGDLWIGGEIAGAGPGGIGGVIQQPPPWSERTPPSIQKVSVRVLSRNLALVDARLVQYGSVTVRQTAPVTILLQRQHDQWLVLTMRVNSCCAPAISLSRLPCLLHLTQ